MPVCAVLGSAQSRRRDHEHGFIIQFAGRPTHLRPFDGPSLAPNFRRSFIGYPASVSENWTSPEASKLAVLGQHSGCCSKRERYRGSRTFMLQPETR